MQRLASGLSSSDIEGMSLDPQAADPSSYQTPRDVMPDTKTDTHDPASPGGASPYNGAAPLSQPVTSDPLWKDPADPKKKPPYSSTPYLGPGPSVDTTTLHNAHLGSTEDKMTTDTLWVEATRDLETELAAEAMVRAKVATSSLWPFLSAARSDPEFGHRMALCEDQLEGFFPEDDFRSRVATSLHQDYLIVSGRTAAQETPEQDAGEGSMFNPGTGDAVPEGGPLTGPEAQRFAEFPAGPDPWNPMNAQYPMTPGHWTVPPEAGWTERPMTFGRQGSAGYVDEGVQTGPAGSPNPDYFAHGSEGVAGTEQDGFPQDISLSEPDERVDMYGANTPQSSQPAPSVSYSNSPKQGYKVTEDTVRAQAETSRNNHGACTHCNRPVYRHDAAWKHLDGDPGHGVRLPGDHPWVQQEMANRVLTTAKKNRWVLAEASSSDTGPTGAQGGGTGQASTDPGAAPPTPQSMEPGGAGSTAMPPLTIPNAQQGANPFSSGGGGGASGPSPGGAAPGMSNPFKAVRQAEVRQRPDAFTPGGVADEYTNNTWNGPAEQKPLQSSTDRGINTPQQPQQPIPTLSSDTQGGPGQDEEDETGGRQR